MRMVKRSQNAVFWITDENNIGYKYFVLLITNKKPYQIIDEIEEVLKACGQSPGYVAFDSTLASTSKSTRYLKAYFNGEKVELLSFRIIDEIPQLFLETSFKFLGENYNYVENSVLTLEDKFRYKLGLVL